MKARRKDKARNLKRRENLKESTLLGKTMMSLPQAKQVNLYLMAKGESDTSSVSSSTSINFEN